MNKRAIPRKPEIPHMAVPVPIPKVVKTAERLVRTIAVRTVRKKFGPGVTAATIQITATLMNTVGISISLPVLYQMKHYLTGLPVCVSPFS